MTLSLVLSYCVDPYDADSTLTIMSAVSLHKNKFSSQSALNQKNVKVIIGKRVLDLLGKFSGKNTLFYSLYIFFIDDYL